MKILVNKSKNEYKYYCDICNKEISFEDKTRHTLSNKFEKNKSEKLCDLCNKCFKELERKVKKGEDKIMSLTTSALKDYLKSRIEAVDRCYEKLLTDIGGVKVINISGLSKKEKEEVINKRNCLIIQKLCYEEILDSIKGANVE